MNLVAADGTHIYLQPLRIDAVFAEPLHRIHMEQNVPVIGLHDAGGLLDRLDGAHFIVDVHDGYQDGIFA